MNCSELVVGQCRKGRGPERTGFPELLTGIALNDAFLHQERVLAVGVFQYDIEIVDVRQSLLLQVDGELSRVERHFAVGHVIRLHEPEFRAASAVVLHDDMEGLPVLGHVLHALAGFRTDADDIIFFHVMSPSLHMRGSVLSVPDHQRSVIHDPGGEDLEVLEELGHKVGGVDRDAGCGIA